MITFKRDKETGEIIAFKDGKRQGAIREMFDDPNELKQFEKDAPLFSNDPPPIMKKMLLKRKKVADNE